MGGGVLQQAAAKEVGILSGEVSEFVDEALDREYVEGDFDPAPGSSGRAAFDGHIGEAKMLRRVGLIDGSSELIGLGLLRVILADDGGIGHAIGPRNEVPFPIDAAAETVHAGWAVSIMGEVVFAGPDELDRPLDTTSDLQRLMIKRYAEAAAQASTHKGNVDGYVALVDAQDFGGTLLGSFAILGWGPYFAAARLKPDGNVHGLHGGVGEERKLVDALDPFRGGDRIWVEGGVGGVPVLLSVEGCA